MFFFYVNCCLFLHLVSSNIIIRGPQKSDLLELLTQIRQGKVASNISVRLERLQVKFDLNEN